MRKALTVKPQTYAALYGPWRPEPASHRGQTVVVVVAAMLWGLTAMSLVWLAFLVGMTALWVAAAGEPIADFLLRYVLIAVGAVAALTALAFAPGVRRLAAERRLLLLGALACPVPTTLAITTWIQAG